MVGGVFHTAGAERTVRARRDERYFSLATEAAEVEAVEEVVLVLRPEEDEREGTTIPRTGSTVPAFEADSSWCRRARLAALRRLARALRLEAWAMGVEENGRERMKGSLEGPAWAERGVSMSRTVDDGRV